MGGGGGDGVLLGGALAGITYDFNQIGLVVNLIKLSYCYTYWNMYGPVSILPREGGAGSDDILRNSCLDCC